MSSADDPRRADPTSDVPATLTFPDGLVGFPHLHGFTLAEVEGTAFVELRSDDDAELGFVAASADDIRPGMTGELVGRGLVASGSVVLVLLSVHGDPPEATANLAGPIVVEPGTATARQLVLEDATYPLRAPIGGA